MMNQGKLKYMVSSKAKGNNMLSIQYYQMFFFEHILIRIAESKYKNNIILKGGLLLSSIIGEDFRATKDTDATLKSIPLKKESVTNIITEILNINVDDNITYEIVDINDIREEDEYGGFQINVLATLEKIKMNLLIELTTGDVITPKEINYKYKCIFEENHINIMAYPIETIIAEKFEAFISRGIDNTRMKDYFDLFMLISIRKNDFDNSVLVKAIENTFNKRKTNFEINNLNSVYLLVRNSKELLNLWKNYQKKMIFAENTPFDNVMDAIAYLIVIIESELVEV